MVWGLHTLVLGTLHCLCLLGLCQESALAHQTQQQTWEWVLTFPWVTFGNVFCSVMGSSCTADPFTCNMAECGSS